MIVGFARRGTGEARHPVQYLTSPHAKDGRLRDPLPEVVRGDPAAIRALIDALPFKHKYTSGWISFSPDKQGQVTHAVERAMMDSFEETVFAGLAPEQRPPVLWVRHAHTGENHFLIPRVELSTGKSLNIAPPTNETRMLLNTWRDMMNSQFGLANPDNPARMKPVQLSQHAAHARAPQFEKTDSPLLQQLRGRLEAAKAQGEKYRGTSHVRTICG